MKHSAAEGGSLTTWVIAAAIALASVLLAGGVVSFFIGGAAGAPVATHGFLHIVARAFYGVGHWQAAGLIDAGLLVLLFTPFARLIAGAVQSARGRDWRFVAIGIVVAALLLTGIVLGTR